MKFFWIWSFCLLAACSASPSPSPATPTLSLAPSPVPSQIPSPAPTLSPSQTPPPAQTALPLPPGVTPAAFPQAWAPAESKLECRKGPGLAFAPSTTFQEAPIIGQDLARRWWYLQVAEGLGRFQFCWIPIEQAAASGDLASIPVAEAEAASLGEVTVTSAETETQSVVCGPQAAPVVFHLTGEIRANGPVERVRYVWELDPGQNNFPLEVTTIPAWDAPARFEREFRFPAQAATYDLRLRAQFPTELVWFGQLRVSCRP